MDFLLREGRAEEIFGIVDRDARRHGDDIGGRPVIGTLERFLVPASRTLFKFCICLSEQFFVDRALLTAELRHSGQQFASIISARAHVGFSAFVAPGAILFPDVYVSAGARIGSCVTAWTGALIEHDCTVEENVEIAPRAVLAGGVIVGSNSFIGISSTILPRLSVGEDAVVGAGAIVTRDVASHTIVVGNPARILPRSDA